MVQKYSHDKIIMEIHLIFIKQIALMHLDPSGGYEFQPSIVGLNI